MTTHRFFHDKNRVVRGFEPSKKYFGILKDLLNTAATDWESDKYTTVKLLQVKLDRQKGLLYVYAAIPSTWTGCSAKQILERLQDSIDNEGPDLWMEGDISIKDSDEINFEPIILQIG